MYIQFLLKDIRINKKLTLEKLSMLSGISTTELNDIENNIKMPTILTLERISSALKVELKELYKIKK